MTYRLLPIFVTCVTCFGQPAEANVNAVAWAQTSAENHAVAVQTYRAAERQMMAALANPNWTAALEQSADFTKLPPAIILDLDETVLDNSSMNARLIKEDKTYTEAEWTRWVNERRAGLIPGAIDFLKVAHANGVAIFYITNRVCDPAKSDDPTVEILQKLNLPFSRHRLFCKTEISDKSPRRARVAAAYRILLLIGDDFNDFLTVPQSQATVEGRRAIARAHDRYWGERWFMLPNPMYGSWERAAGYKAAEKMQGLKF
jgi:5'-nucleotidase (lipoprotein e(P4) family)